jgi:hypothetical protein
MYRQPFVQGRARDDNLRPLGNFADEDISVGKQLCTQLTAVKDVLDEARTTWAATDREFRL